MHCKARTSCSTTWRCWLCPIRHFALGRMLGSASSIRVFFSFLVRFQRFQHSKRSCAQTDERFPDRIVAVLPYARPLIKPQLRVPAPSQGSSRPAGLCVPDCTQVKHLRYGGPIALIETSDPETNKPSMPAVTLPETDPGPSLAL